MKVVKNLHWIENQVVGTGKAIISDYMNTLFMR